ncbi:thiol reductant ABC exporter subunit CydD [Pseudalkalibacillus hwajinpoensis]|uniref:thiol reductant ABC exporter subunit CydD n=1 Tax=Guptibacillus hwajinpoensis TaxID=208199 RepID=UPI001CD58A1E|nr:thiol reductant ABC exporter subunit CydD [Pseudalkalibacillus hwajinpoensis]MCA0991990.1 thiol reductant ABC exporter subunit CydD [Pseudalkalibacillus hwajinpoensis]
MGKILFQLKDVKKVLFILTLLTVLQGIAIILQARWLAEAVTRLFEGEALQRIYSVVSLFLIAFIMRHLVKLIMTKVTDRYAAQTAASLKKDAVAKLFALGPHYAAKWGTGNLVTLLIDGTKQFRLYLELFIPKLTAMLIVAPLVLISVWTLDVTSAIILSLTLPILIGFLILLGLAAKKKADKQWSTHRVLSNHFVDSLRGLETLKYLGLSEKHAASIKEVSEKYRKSTMSTLRVAFLSSFALDFFTMLGIAAVAVFLGLRLVEGEISLMPALMILILSPEFFLPVRELGNDYHATLDGQEAGRRLLDMIQTPDFKEENGTIPHWSDKDLLTIQHLSVDHGNERKALQNISFSVKGKQKIGIIGESGSGKSTLIDILGGFLEGSEGTIEINGQELTHLKHEEWQKQLFYIPQDPHLFHDSLANNIRFYNHNASLEEVGRAAEAAGLRKVIDQLPNGLNEKIGEGGREISGGQAQRIALARAFLEDRSILLLDEPTAQLDVETEYDIKKKILPLLEDKLVFMATHRLHWMMEMDLILMLEKGKLVEVGTHEELMSRRGSYYQMVCLQMEGVS